MKLHELKPAEGSTRVRRRVGRGLGSGMGKQATRGAKGQNARTVRDLKAARCLCTVVFQSAVLKMY